MYKPHECEQALQVNTLNRCLEIQSEPVTREESIIKTGQIKIIASAQPAASSAAGVGATLSYSSEISPHTQSPRLFSSELFTEL